MAVATWWETTFTLFELSADRYAYFVQSLEDRFYRHDEAERLGAALTLDLPVAFITEARWIADTLAGLRPDAPCYLVRNGIDKEVFAPLERAPVTSMRPAARAYRGLAELMVQARPRGDTCGRRDARARHVTVVCGDRGALGEVAADEVVGPLSHREMAELYAAHRRGAQALERGGHVRAAAGGVPSRRDVRRNAR